MVSFKQFLKATPLPPVRYEYTPAIPGKCKKATNKISPVFVGGSHQLREMVTADNTSLSEKATTFIQVTLPDSELLDKDPGLFLPYDEPRYGPLKLLYIHDESGVHLILQKFVFPTVQRVIHQIAPIWDVHTFHQLLSGRSGTLQPFFKPYLFAEWEAGNQDAKVVKKDTACVAVFAMPAWLAGEEDLMDFVKCSKFSPYNCKDQPPEEGYKANVEAWEKYQMFWASISDHCCNFNVRHFVLTTYDFWVFGGFSKYFDTGFASAPIPFDQQDPTVLTVLTYWIFSSLEYDEFWTAPEVSAVLAEYIGSEGALDGYVYADAVSDTSTPAPHDNEEVQGAARLETQADDHLLKSGQVTPKRSATPPSPCITPLRSPSPYGFPPFFPSEMFYGANAAPGLIPPAPTTSYRLPPPSPLKSKPLKRQDGFLPVRLKLRRKKVLRKSATREERGPSPSPNKRIKGLQAEDFSEQAQALPLRKESAANQDGEEQLAVLKGLR